MAEKRKTNTQVMRDIMEFSSYGAIAQMFVMDACLKLAEAVAETTESDYEKGCPVHPSAWIGVAKEIREKLNAHIIKAK